MHATAGTQPKAERTRAGREETREDPTSSRVERELADALRSARSIGREALALARLELAKLRARGRQGLRTGLLGLWLGVALLAATWTAGTLALRGLAAGFNVLFDSPWVGDVLAPACFFGVLGGAVFWRWKAVDRERVRELRKRFESPESPSNATPAEPPQEIQGVRS